MTRTVFTTLTDHASAHLTKAANLLSDGDASTTAPEDLHELESLLLQHADLTDALGPSGPHDSRQTRLSS